MIRKYLICATLFTFILSGVLTNTAKAQMAGGQDSEQKIESIVAAVPEVQKYLKDNKGLHPLVVFHRAPSAAVPYYWVEVGISSNEKFWASHHYYVQPKTYKIFYRDMMANSVDPKNSLLTLEQWRKWRYDPGYQRMHTYKNGKLVVLNGQ